MMSLNCAKVPDLSCMLGMMLRWGPKRLAFTTLHSGINQTQVVKDGCVNQNCSREINNPCIFFPADYKSRSFKSSQLLCSKVPCTVQSVGYPNVDFFQQVNQMRVQSLLENKTQRERHISTLNTWNKMLLADKQQLALISIHKAKTLHHWERLLDPERFDTHEKLNKFMSKHVNSRKTLQKFTKEDNNLHHIKTEKIHDKNNFSKNIVCSSKIPNTDIGGVSLFKGTNKLPSPPPDKGKGKTPSGNKATPMQLAQVLHTLTEELPWFFFGGHKYDIYHKNVLFVNGLTSNSKTRGLWLYRLQMTLMRWAALIGYTQVTLNILNITKHDKESTIEVRWQVQGLARFRAFAKYLTVKVSPDKQSYIDAISTLEVGNQGKVVCHVIEKVMKRKDEEMVPKFTVNAAAVMFVALGLNPSNALLPGVLARKKINPG